MYHPTAPGDHRPVPALWFFTDPARTPDPVAIARTLPRGAAVVYRHFGAADRTGVARALRALPGLVLLIGADWRLAAQVRADGVHLPERLLHRVETLKRALPGWIVSVAAHSSAAVRRAEQHADAIVLSPVFPSRSPSATGKPLGLMKAAGMARRAAAPVIALGGVHRTQLPALTRAGFAGAAGIDLFLGGQA